MPKSFSNRSPKADLRLADLRLSKKIGSVIDVGIKTSRSTVFVGQCFENRLPSQAPGHLNNGGGIGQGNGSSGGNGFGRGFKGNNGFGRGMSNVAGMRGSLYRAWEVVHNSIRGNGSVGLKCGGFEAEFQALPGVPIAVYGEQGIRRE